MDFQAFRMPEPGTAGVNAGLDSLNNVLVRAAQADRERQRLMAENLRNAGQTKRQGQQDFQAALMDAHKAAAAGDMKLAQSIMAPYGAQMQQRAVAESPDWAPKLNQGEVDFADQLPMNRPGGPAPAQGPQGPVDAISSPTTGSPEGIEQLMQRAAPLSQQQAPNKLVALAQADNAKKQRMAQFLTGKFNGQDWTLDPDAGRQESMQRADKAFYDASGEGSDMADIVREQYPAQRAAALASGQSLDAQDMMKGFAGEARLRRQEAADAARGDATDRRLSQQVEIERMREQARRDLEEQQQGGGKYHHRGTPQGGGGSGPTRLQLAQAKPVVAEMEKSLAPVTQKGGLRDRLMQSEAAIQSIKENPGNPVSWVNAIDAAIRTNTGRAAIKAQYDLYTSHAHGTIDTFNTWLSKLQNGAPSEEQQRNFMGAFEASHNELRAQAKQYYDNFRRYDNDLRIAQNPAVKQAYEGLERNTFGTMPGYGESKGGPLSAEELAAKAHATKPGDPLYDSAQRWLKAHGL